MKKLRKLVKPIISLLVILSMVLSLPTPVIAQTMITESIDSISMSDSTSDEADVVQGNIIGEDISKRDEFTKHFITDAGTTIAAQYAVPVHYKDDDGDYVDYDNSLTSSQVISAATSDEATLDEATADEVSYYSLRIAEEEPQIEEILVNKKSNSKVSHYKKSGKANLIEIERDGHKISWGYSGANVVTAQEKANKTSENLTGNDAYLVLPNLCSTVLYENIYNNVDLEVINSTTGVKENLILKSSNAKNVFKIDYNIGDLIAESEDEHNISLKDSTGNNVYIITAPYMKDSKGETSKALELKILSNNKGKLSVKLTADKTWLKDKTRAYPVTIDPNIEYESTPAEVSCTYIESIDPNTPNGNEWYVYAGTLADGEEHRSLIRINALPELGNGNMIVYADVNLALLPENLQYTSYVGVYEITKEWEENDVTWNSFGTGGYDNSLIDYRKFVAGQSAEWIDWDITELVKKWYNGSANNGFMLKIVDGTSVNQNIRFASSFFGGETTNQDYIGTRPFFTLAYRNNKGLEDYWSYTSVDCGKAGTAYINDYSGNLVFEMPIASTASPVMPAGLSYIYNSYCPKVKYTTAKPYNGWGWKMNVQQTVFTTSEDVLGEYQEIFPYVYTDGDGTEHYFRETTEDDGPKYYDEDGYGLELKMPQGDSETKYTIENKNNEKFYFNNKGFLYKIENKSSQSININYSGTTISSVSDNEGDAITFPEPNGYSYVTKIQDSAERITSITYSGTYINTITYPDGTSVSFGYDSTTKRLTSVTDTDNSRIEFVYSNNGSNGVSSVIEYGVNGTLGQKITFDRSKHNTTTVQSSGEDRTYNNNDDIITVYQFDNFGRATSVHSKSKAGEYLGASACGYTDTNNVKKANKISQSYSLGANKDNLLVNHSMENVDSANAPTNWNKASWGSSDVSFTVSSQNNGLYGKNTMQMNVTSCIGNARGRVYQDISSDYFEAGKTYTLSCYVKTENIIPASGVSKYGAVVCATFFNGSTAIGDYYSNYITIDTDENINNGFRRISVTFNAPASGEFTKIRINLALRSATGTVYFDAVQVEQSNAAGNYNMLENSSFERLSSSTQPTDWTGIQLTDSTSYDCISNANVEGNHCYRITGSTTKWKNLYQNVYLNSDAKEDDTYILSGWATGDSIPIGSNNARFRLFARVYYTDGNYKDKADISFNDSLANVNWQYASGAFNLSDEDDATTKTPLYIKVYLVYNYQSNRGYFDNLMLTKEAVPSYTYDDEGNLTSVVANAEQNSTYTYTDDLLTSVVDPKNNRYTYQYDDKERVTKATSASGLSYNYLYDAKGNVKSVTAQKDINMKIKSSVDISYPATGADEYTATVYDQNAFTSTSVYNAKNGTLKQYTDNNDNVTNYTYLTANDLPDTITSGSQSVKYYYDNKYKHLTSLKHGNTTYGFTYDEFGNRIATMVGSSVLATNTFGAHNGYLQKMTYGNNDTVEYTYDRYGNVATIKKDDVDVVENFADSSGLVMRSKDLVNSLDTRITYDSTGRLMSKDIHSTSNDWLRSFEYDYDLNNNLVRLSFADRYDTSNSLVYEYDNNDQLSKTIWKNKSNTVVNVNYSYDGLNRPTHKTIATTNPIKHSYTYLDAFGYGSGYTTTYLNTEVSKAFTYRYEYDDNGNITKIYNSTSSNASPILSYVYDNYNQLTAVADFANGEQYNYTYDTNGNITSLVHYEMDSAFSHPISTLQNYTYTYGKATWGDLLTKFNGQTITYDQIGNPLNYRDGITMTWQNGRELASFENDDVSVTYTYDPDGLRTQKNYEGLVTTDYVYEGGLLKQMKYGSYIFTFSYDAYGSPIGFEFKEEGSTSSTYYYYGVNSRGDVEALYNSAGTQIASYSYDPYGKPISINKLVSGHTTAIEVQPLRYRSYVYDFETGFYYVSSRYYDPEIGRFINGDSVIAGVWGSIQGYNMFAYCFNNPVNMIDNAGTWPSWNDIKTGFEKVVDWVDDNIIQPVASFVEKSIDYLTPPSKENHYNRNQNNVQFPEEYDETFFKEWDDSVSANCHQFSAPNRDNVKYVSPDGRYEAIYDVNNKLVTDPRDVGTYNFVSPNEDPFGHFIKDVIPWIQHGNSPDDSTEWWQRALSFIEIYV